MDDFTFPVLSDESYFRLFYVGFTLVSFLFPFVCLPFLGNPLVRIELYKSLCVPGGEADLYESKGGLFVLL